jgi:hypothetical protein
MVFGLTQTSCLSLQSPITNHQSLKPNHKANIEHCEMDDYTQDW